MTRKYFFFFLFLLFLPSFIYASSFTYVLDDVFFNDTWASCDGTMWDKNTGNPCGGLVFHGSSFGGSSDCAAGANNTGFCGSVTGLELALEADHVGTAMKNYSNQRLIIGFDFAYLADTCGLSDSVVYLELFDKNISRNNFIKFDINQDGVNYIKTYASSQAVSLGAEACTGDFTTYIPSNQSIRILLDLVNNKYSFMSNGDATGCYEKNLSSNFSLGKISININGCNSPTLQKSWIDNFFLANASTVGETESQSLCDGFDYSLYPTLFCDGFVYTDALFNHGWSVKNGDLSVNTHFHPDNNTFIWNTSYSDGQVNPYSIGIKLPYYFQTPYQQGIYEYVFSSFNAPSFNQVFDINNTANNSRIDFIGYDDNNILCFDVSFRVNDSANSIFVYNYSSSQFEYMGQWAYNTGTSIKAIERITSRGHDVEFNTSYKNNSLTVFVGYTTVINSIDALDQNCRNINSVYFDRVTTDISDTMESFIFAVGSDINENTIPEEIIPFQASNITTTQPPTGSTDLNDAIKSTFNLFGMYSTASKILVSLFVLLAVSLCIAVICIKYQVSSGVMLITIGVLDFFTTIILTYLGLIPLWIILSIVGLFITIAVLLLVIKLRGG